MYSVIVNDKYIEGEDELYSYLTFNFDCLENAISFANQILKISMYAIEIVPYIKGE